MVKRKIALFFTGFASAVFPITSAISCSLFDRGDWGSFMNYQDYMAPELQDEVDSKFAYEEFEDLPELYNFILDERVSAAVGTDYFNVNMIKEGRIAKIDFSKIFADAPAPADESAIATYLQTLYSVPAWSILSAFVLGDVDQDGTEDKLWEYMVPYFAQSKVVAVSIPRINSARAATGLAPLDKDISQSDFAALFPDKTYHGILTTLYSWGARKITINDYVRDNVMIGSESADGSSFGEAPTLTNYNAQINNFFHLLSNWQTRWETSGVGSVETVIDHNITVGAYSDIGDSQVALMYNGDSLFGANGGNSGEQFAGQIRVVTPQNPIFLLDGVIIPSYLSKANEELASIYDVIKFLYSGAQKKYVAGISDYEIDNNLFKNFDFVNYAPAFKDLANYVDDNYFTDEKGNTNEVDKYILDVTANAVSKINANHVIAPLDANLNTRLRTEYELQKTKT